jgi:hypothetical protein
VKITDSPHAAGSPEHNEWVRKVFIPAVNAERTVEDRAKYGAESIGGALIRDGLEHWFPLVTFNLNAYLTAGMRQAGIEAQVAAEALERWRDAFGTDPIEVSASGYTVGGEPMDVPAWNISAWQWPITP